MATNSHFWNELQKQEARAVDAHDERAQANPYYSAYAWWFEDAGKEYGPFESQRDALKALLTHAIARETWLRRKERHYDRARGEGEG